MVIKDSVTGSFIRYMTDDPGLVVPPGWEISTIDEWYEFQLTGGAENGS
jgi:hypothetical protein